MSQRYSPPVRRNGFPFEPDAEPGWPRWSDVELEQRPDEPARAASMEAFNASRFVWSAISEITFTIPPISQRWWRSG